MTADLVAFLRARLDEDQRTAEGLNMATRMLGAEPDFYGAGGPAAAAYWRHFDPARVLAEVDAKRRILEQHHRSGQTCPRCSLGTEDGQVVFERDPCGTLRLLALPYAGHPDYRAEWAPHVEVARARWLP
jgi:hypothetical protein